MSNSRFFAAGPTYLAVQDVSGWYGSRTGADDLWVLPKIIRAQGQGSRLGAASAAAPERLSLARWASSLIRLIPVLRRGDLMPGVYVDLRDFVAQHSVCGRPAGDADALDHGYRVWARCPCGARFERWVAADEAEADLLRTVLHDSRRLQPRIQ
jgi:hypothetical protein